MVQLIGIIVIVGIVFLCLVFIAFDRDNTDDIEVMANEIVDDFLSEREVGN